MGTLGARLSSDLTSCFISSIFSIGFSFLIDLKYLSIIEEVFLGLALSLLVAGGSGWGVGGSSSHSWNNSSSSSLFALYLNESDVFGDFPEIIYQIICWQTNNKNFKQRNLIRILRKNDFTKWLFVLLSFVVKETKNYTEFYFICALNLRRYFMSRTLQIMLNLLLFQKCFKKCNCFTCTWNLHNYDNI